MAKSYLYEKIDNSNIDPENFDILKFKIFLCIHMCDMDIDEALNKENKGYFVMFLVCSY